MRRELRCCCDAGRLIGTIEVPDDMKPGPIDYATDDGKEVRLELAMLYSYKGPVDNSRLAVKSLDTSIETLRTIPSFWELTK